VVVKHPLRVLTENVDYVSPPAHRKTSSRTIFDLSEGEGVQSTLESGGTHDSSLQSLENDINASILISKGFFCHMSLAANSKDCEKPAKRPIGRPKGWKNGPNAGKGGRPVRRPKKGADSQGTTEANLDLTADSLVLRKVSFPVDRHLHQRLANIVVTDEISLSSVDDLVDVFVDAPLRKLPQRILEKLIAQYRGYLLRELQTMLRNKKSRGTGTNSASGKEGNNMGHRRFDSFKSDGGLSKTSESSNGKDEEVAMKRTI
jgi:hypothetical protein